MARDWPPLYSRPGVFGTSRGPQLSIAAGGGGGGPHVSPPPPSPKDFILADQSGPIYFSASTDRQAMFDTVYINESDS
jgi:hypothetical protein